ncbi:MAG: hypothetical protein H6733_04430 [Alphaproteobacteria bacterium]|nr:hypothetical protein [Alphaproteobacteria bacterium]
MRAAVVAIPALLAAACVTEAECTLRQAGARRQALEDARTCDFRPEALPEPTCGGVNARPMRAYEGVYCSAATLACIQGDDAARIRCFGDPGDTGLAPIPTPR